MILNRNSAVDKGKSKGGQKCQDQHTFSSFIQEIFIEHLLCAWDVAINMMDGVCSWFKSPLKSK